MSAIRTAPLGSKDFAEQAVAALTRAAQRARERAAATHTSVVIWRNGQVEKLVPAESGK